MIRLLLVDDHAIVREGFKRLLEGSDDCIVVGEAADPKQALIAAIALHPDAAIVDISLGSGESGLTLLPQLIEAVPAMRCLVVSMHDDPSFVARAIESGASGYISKGAAATELLPLLRRMQAGERVFSSDIVPMAGSPAPALTERERELLGALLSGEVPKAIALRLGISDKTLYRHRANIMEKLGVRQPSELPRVARERGLMAMI